MAEKKFVVPPKPDMRTAKMKEALAVAKEAREYLSSKSKSKGGITNFSHITASPTAWPVGSKLGATHRHDGCFGYHTGSAPAKAPCYLFVSWTNSYLDEQKVDKKQRAILVEYLDWICKSSTFRHGFYTKSGENILTKGAIHHTHMPLLYVLESGIATRYATEAQFIAYTWHKMKDYIDPNAAFVLAHRVRWDDSNKIFIRLDHKTGHSLFNGFGKDEFTRFVNEDFSYMADKEPMMKKNYGYTDFNEIWGPKRREGSPNPISTPDKFFQPITLKKNWSEFKLAGFTLEQAAEFLPQLVEINTVKEKK